MGAPQSLRLVLTGIAAVAVAGGLMPASAAPARIKLPTPADAVSPTTPLIAPRAGEVDVSKVPGQVDDSELARVSLGPDGSVVGVSVAQILTFRGIGDFNVVLPGPALHVVGPADQATQPGLRRRTILYQGFVPGNKVLRSTAILDPGFERFRVPLLVSVRFLQEGREVKPPVTGPVEVQFTIANNTSRLVPVSVGTPRAGELAGLLDGLRAQLRAGRTPVAGRRGVPASLASTSAVEVERIPVMVPFSLGGSLSFPWGSIDGLRVAGPAEVAASGNAATFRALVPSAAYSNGTVVVRLSGDATKLGAPHVELSAQSVMPEPAQLDPPGAATWERALRGASSAERRTLLALAERTMWQTLRLPEFEAYLGNPGKGTSSTRYEYVSARPTARRAPPREEGLRHGALLLTLLAAALAIRNAAVLWTRS